MARPFASGKNSIAFCDRCDRKIMYRDLKVEIYDSRPNGLRVCSDCLDKDNPQLKIKNLKVQDPQGLQNPRPDKDQVGDMPPSDVTALEDFINAYTSGN